MNPFADEDETGGVDALDLSTLEILDNYDGTWTVRCDDRDIADFKGLYFANLLAGALIGGAYGAAMARGDFARIRAIDALRESNPLVGPVVDAMRRGMRGAL